MKLSYLPKNLKLRVLPYSLWLAYDIKNFNYINSLLPTNTELANIKLLQNETQKCKFSYETTIAFFFS